LKFANAYGGSAAPVVVKKSTPLVSGGLPVGVSPRGEIYVVELPGRVAAARRARAAAARVARTDIPAGALRAAPGSLAAESSAGGRR
jgi:hypothetical protein